MRLPIALTIALLVACLAHFAPSFAADVNGLQSFDNTERHVVASVAAGRRYNVFVGVPAGYDPAESRRYPTVYVLDGGELYPLFVSYAHYLRSGEEIPEVIVVGIAYGSRNWRQGNNRSHDFTAPAAGQDHWGGATAFQRFLADELMPMIEAEYRSDPAQRIVFGQSLGGQFVLHAAQSEPDLFAGYIASNPALHRNLDHFLRPVAARTESSTRGKLFVSSATRDEPRFREPALRWMSHWRSVESTPWELRAVDLPDHGHFSAAPIAFRSGLRWILRGD